MKTLTATELRHKFGEVVEGLKLEPVLVEKSGRPVAVILSYEDFQRFEDLEDAWWGEQARKAASEGLLSAKETMSWVEERMNEASAE
jgi:antitoxin Phd